MVSLRRFSVWCSTVPFHFIILPAPFSDQLSVDKSFSAFANASFFYTLATCIHVHGLQTINRLQRPARRACNGGKITLYREFAQKWGGRGGGGGGDVTASRA